MIYLQNRKESFFKGGENMNNNRTMMMSLMTLGVGAVAWRMMRNRRQNVITRLFA